MKKNRQMAASNVHTAHEQFTGCVLSFYAKVAGATSNEDFLVPVSVM